MLFDFFFEIKFMYSKMPKSLAYYQMDVDKYIHLCDPSPCQDIEHHHPSKSRKIFIPLPHQGKEASCLSFIQYVCMMVFLGSFMFLCVSVSHCFFIDEQYSIVRTYHPFVDGHLSFIQFLAITNKSVRNILIQIFLWIYAVGS